MSNQLAAFVQFTHPGGEHGWDCREVNSGLLRKKWNGGGQRNRGGHARKFLSTQGKTVDDKGRVSEAQELRFWGEWEPPSRVERLNRKPPQGFPKWLHRPFLPEKFPLREENATGGCATPTGCKGESGCQNTDPYTFGDCFKFYTCKLIRRSKPPQVTSVGRLAPGSLILFGSTTTKHSGGKGFQVDTVFVAGDSIVTFEPSRAYDAAYFGGDNVFYRASFRQAFPDPSLKGITLPFYRGTTPGEDFQGMYSFVPAATQTSHPEGFARLLLTTDDFCSVGLPGVFTENLNSAPKVTELATSEIRTIWDMVVAKVAQEGLLRASWLKSPCESKGLEECIP